MHTSVERYLVYLEDRGRAPTTLKTVRQDMLGFIAWWEAKRQRTFDPSLMRYEDARDWRNARQRAHKAATTVNRGLTILRGYCAWASANGLMTGNPMQDLKDIPLQALSPRSLPTEALDALLREVLTEEDDALRARDQAMLSLLIFTGLRVQELCDMQVRDIDLAAGMLVVRSGKGNKARRLPLHPDAQRPLREYLEEVRCPEGLPRISSLEEAEPLFVRKEMYQPGQPLIPGIDQRLLQRLIRKLGEHAAQRLQSEGERESDVQRAEVLLDIARRLRKATPHMLRHSLAKRLLDNGAKLTEVQRVLGHSRLDTTARYLTPSEDDLRQALLKAGV